MSKLNKNRIDHILNTPIYPEINYTVVKSPHPSGFDYLKTFSTVLRIFKNGKWYLTPVSQKWHTRKTEKACYLKEFHKTVYQLLVEIEVNKNILDLHNRIVFLEDRNTMSESERLKHPHLYNKYLNQK